MEMPPVHPVPSPSVLLAATFGADGRVRFRDGAWRSVFGDGLDAWARLSPDDRALVVDALDEAAAGYVVSHQIVTVPSPGREAPLPVLIHFVPVHSSAARDDRPAPADAVAVTAEVLAEPTSFTHTSTRRHRFELVGRMTTGIVHDLNNLLASMLGHLELIRAQHDLPPDAAEHWHVIERAALDGALLIGKIQRFLRQDKDESYAAVDVSEIAREAGAFTRPYWQNEALRQNIAIDYEEDLTAVDAVSGAASELREVLVNLILNAVQAMPVGGTLLVRTWQTDERVFVAVADTGTGMTEEVRAHAFEPMYSTKGASGNGMGLAVAGSIVQAHGGRIEVDSAPGTGTVMRLSLPRAPRETPSDSDGRRAPTASLRVLVVDDEPRVGHVLSRLLGLRGHTVAVATSGADALARPDLGAFDAVITDLGMPDMNGRELAARLRERCPALPVVLLTGDTEHGHTDDTIAAVLAKPFRANDVETALRRVTGSAAG